MITILLGRGRSGRGHSITPRLRRHNSPTIEHQKALVHRFGIKVITIAILVLKISTKKAEMIAIRATQHEGATILFTNKIDCHSMLSIQGVPGVDDLPRGGKLLDFLIKVP